ncbi:cyclin-dependent kinase F-4-like [Papaver somniferum]|uniref:cyclin-dependent kinase F-4-like n=1 Tax=Papaver somniferum TaxID=3469 RepID=UPI000E6FDBF4|nr:cyclin-dependent kinase F-4-like [Papaver somniferum]
MDDYTLLEKVGEGSFGYVWKAKDNRRKEIVAMKQMKESCTSLDECLELTEVKALIKLWGEPNIVRFRDVVLVNQVLYLVFDYVESTLHHLIEDRIHLCTEPELRDELLRVRVGLCSEPEIRGWSRQIFLALAQMHRPGGYIHRDLKPANLLVTKGGEIIKIADFGQALEVGCQAPCSDYVTTRWYRAPEMLLNSVTYNSAVDMWAVGAIMAELYSFSALFPGKNRQDQLDQICNVIGSPTHESWADGIQLANSCGYKFPHVPVFHGLASMIPSASPEAIDLIKSLCSWDPKKRPTAMEALQHPYFAPSLCELPEPMTSAKLEQRLYLTHICPGAKLLFGAF